MLIPIIEPLNMQTVWEHTPLSYYRYGEYPRFQRPVGAHQPRSEWRRVDVEADLNDLPRALDMG